VAITSQPLHTSKRQLQIISFYFFKEKVGDALIKKNVNLRFSKSLHKQVILSNDKISDNRGISSKFH